MRNGEIDFWRAFGGAVLGVFILKVLSFLL